MLEMEMTEGVAQGDPNGPGMFVMAYEDLGVKIDADRAYMSFEVPETLVQGTGLGGHVALHRHMYIDDHAEVHTIDLPKHIAPLVIPIIAGQEEWGLKTNMDKSFVIIQMQGRGSRKRIKNMAGELKVGVHGNIRIAESHTYFGVMINADGKMNEEVSQRIAQAQQAMQ